LIAEVLKNCEEGVLNVTLLGPDRADRDRLPVIPRDTSDGVHFAIRVSDVDQIVTGELSGVHRETLPQ
jgi:hypothetical protein